MKHPKNQAGTILPQHAYIMLLGSHNLHPFRIFSFRHFTKNTTRKISSTHMTLDKAATIRVLCNSTPGSNLEEEVTNFLLLYQNKKTTTNQPKTPSASATTPNNNINQLTQLLETPSPNPFTHIPSTPSLTYLYAARQSSLVQPNSLHIIVYCGVKINHQLRVQFFHKINNTPPSHNQAWIDTLYQDMVANILLTI